jgi:hypothetical protein
VVWDDAQGRESCTRTFRPSLMELRRPSSRELRVELGAEGTFILRIANGVRRGRELAVSGCGRPCVCSGAKLITMRLMYGYLIQGVSYVWHIL